MIKVGINFLFLFSILAMVDLVLMVDHGLTMSVCLMSANYRVKSGKFGPCLFLHNSNVGIRNKLTKQTVKILMGRLIRSRLILIYTVCKCVPEFT